MTSIMEFIMLERSIKKKLISGLMGACFFASQSQGAVIGAAIAGCSWKAAENREGVTQNACGGYNMNSVEALGLSTGLGLVLVGTIGAFTGFGFVPGLVMDLNTDADQVSDDDLASKLVGSIPDLSSADSIELAKLVKANQGSEDLVEQINEFLEDNGYVE